MLHLAAILKTIMAVWAWLKGLIPKKASLSSWRMKGFFRKKKSRRGVEVEFGLSMQRDGIPTQGVVSQSNASLKQFPSAIGCECFPALAHPVDPETLPLAPVHALAPIINPSKPLRQSVQSIGAGDQQYVSKPRTRRKQTSGTVRIHRQASAPARLPSRRASAGVPAAGPRTSPGRARRFCARPPSRMCGNN
jgi:hypothetical protein